MNKFSDNKFTGWTQSKYQIRNNWESEAIASFQERMKLAFDLASYFDDVDREELKNAARKNALINMVSALEVYFRDLIVERNGCWAIGGFADLLKEKMSLNDAYDCFKDTTVTKEALVAHYYSFQNIESIANIFGCLASCDFLKCIDDAEYLAFAGDCPIGHYDFHHSFPEWKKLLVVIFNTRHRIVHEANLDEILTDEDWCSYYSMSAALPYAVEWALHQLDSERWYNEAKRDNADDLPF
jgi:hypothetical protein